MSSGLLDQNGIHPKILREFKNEISKLLMESFEDLWQLVKELEMDKTK